MTINLAKFLAEFDSKPRSPAEMRERNRLVTAWWRRAERFLAAQVQIHADIYQDERRFADATHLAMAMGGPKTVTPGSSVSDHMRDFDAFLRELDVAEERALAAIDAAQALAGRDPLQFWEEHLRKFPAFAANVSIENPTGA